MNRRILLGAAIGCAVTIGLSASPALAQSCAGHCGGQSPGGCWCDSACSDFGDCCADICICSIPMINDISPPNGPTAGGETLTIQGAKFGSSTGVVKLGNTPMTVISWADNQIMAEIPPGVGVGFAISVTRASSCPGTGSSADHGIFFDYSAPMISSVSPSQLPTAGGGQMIITGTNFGPAPGGVTLSGIALQIDSWDHHEIRAVIPSGVGSNRPLVVQTASGQSNVVTVDYLPAMLDEILPTTAPTTGGVLMTLTGSNFGPSTPLVRIGTTTLGVESWSDGLITVIIPPGVGVNLPVQVLTLGGLTNSKLFSYNGPALVSLSPSSGPTLGGTVIMLTGSDFGPEPGSVRMEGVDLPIQSWGHGQITSLTPPGVGLNRPIIVQTASGQSNSVSFSYHAPTLNTAFPATGPTAGGTLVTITGQNFGPIAGTVRLGGADVAIQSWGQEQIVALTPPGVGLNQPIVVQTASGLSDAVFFNYHAPTLANVSPTTGPTAGGTQVTLMGHNFGPTPGTVRLGGVDMAIQSWGQEQIVALTPPGVGLNQPIVVQTASGASNLLTFNYLAPTIVSITPGTGSPEGGGAIIITGQNFGPGGGTVSFGGHPAVIVQWTHQQITAIIPAGCGEAVPVVVQTLSGQSNAVVFNYVPSHPAGDLNCNCAIDPFDVTLFVQALIDPNGPTPNCDPNAADINDDGQIDGADIQGFVDLLIGG